MHIPLPKKTERARHLWRAEIQSAGTEAGCYRDPTNEVRNRTLFFTVIMVYNDAGL